jgi:hypothetical protein
VTQRTWIYNDHQHMAINYGKKVPHCLLPFTFGTMDVPTEEKEDLAASKYHDRATQWRLNWYVSQPLHLMEKFFENCSSYAVRVDQIVCFGLGSLTTPTRPDIPVSSSRRHLADAYCRLLVVSSLCDILRHEQHGHRPKVYAQDPYYKGSDISFLSEHLGITVLPSPEGFKILDDHTFVIADGNTSSVRQIAVDMTSDTKGPVGFLCKSINGDGVEGNRKTEQQAFRDKDHVYSKCNNSPALWKYKHKCNWKEGGCLDTMGLYLKRAKKDTDA